jgi:anti-sigma factor RsiW
MMWSKQPCRRFARQMSLLAADELAPAEREALEAHLKQCSACQSHWQSLQTLVSRLEILRDARPALEAPSTLRARWQTSITPKDGSTRSNLCNAPCPPGEWTLFLDIRRWTWGAIGACWIAIAWLHFSAPVLTRPSIHRVTITFEQLALVLNNQGYPAPPDMARPVKPLGNRL